MVSQLGFDIVLIDQEHSAMNIETMINMVNDIQHISSGRSSAMVRKVGAFIVTLVGRNDENER